MKYYKQMRHIRRHNRENKLFCIWMVKSNNDVVYYYPANENVVESAFKFDKSDKFCFDLVPISKEEAFIEIL